jgi:hypothetical protein
MWELHYGTMKHGSVFATKERNSFQKKQSKRTTFASMFTDTNATARGDYVNKVTN